MNHFPELHSVAEDGFLAAIYVVCFGTFLVLSAAIVNAVQWWRKRKLMAEYIETERRR